MAGPMIDWQSISQDNWLPQRAVPSHGFIDGCVENTLAYDQLLEDGLDCFRSDEVDLEMYMRPNAQFQPGMQLSSYSAFSLIPQDDHIIQHISITDFSPSTDRCAGGTKVLICLSAEIGRTPGREQVCQ